MTSPLVSPNGLAFWKPYSLMPSKLVNLFFFKLHVQSSLIIKSCKLLIIPIHNHVSLHHQNNCNYSINTIISTIILYYYFLDIKMTCMQNVSNFLINPWIQKSNPCHHKDLFPWWCQIMNVLGGPLHNPNLFYNLSYS